MLVTADSFPELLASLKPRRLRSSACHHLDVEFLFRFWGNGQDPLTAEQLESIWRVAGQNHSIQSVSIKNLFQCHRKFVQQVATSLLTRLHDLHYRHVA